MAEGKPIRVEIASGELIDKITILEIKSERIADAEKLRNVHAELEMLRIVRDRAVPESRELADLTSRLKSVNESLWNIEDDIRTCERTQDFGPHFVSLARAVYHNNDQRAALKREINKLLDSTVVEEKAYAESTSGSHRSIFRKGPERTKIQALGCSFPRKQPTNSAKEPKKLQGAVRSGREWQLDHKGN